MDFLKDVLGDDLFSKVAEKLNAYNGNEANKDALIKLGNLASGEYVGKGKYEALQQTISGKDAELANANNLIAELKKASKGNEDIMNKVAAYESENAKLQEELKQTKIKSAIKVALLSEKAVDVDYLTFKLNEKLNEKGEFLDLDENENIKGWDDKLAGLKVQFPNMFESASVKKIEENKLEKNDEATAFTREDILKMSYQKRATLAAENPDAYNAAMHGN